MVVSWDSETLSKLQARIAFTVSYYVNEHFWDSETSKSPDISISQNPDISFYKNR